LRTLVKALLVAGFGLLVAALWLRHELPPPDRLLESLQQEPEQVQLREAPFETIVGGVTYTIKPLYSYELHGLMVSMHDTSTWWDYLHREWNDHLNVVDFCVIWGDNASSGAYRDIQFSSGQFTCNLQWDTAAAAAAFDMTKISNNHLLTDDPLIAKKLRSVRIGDQVRFRGYLAEYSHNHNGQGFNRGTSTVRNDTGNGACETVFVKDFDIVRRGGGPWRSMFWVAWALIGAGIVGWFRLPLSQH
jgi:hypothetical protein